MLNAFYSAEKEPSNYYKCFSFASVLLHLFFNSNTVSFVEEGVQEYFLPQGARYPSYATGED